MSGVWLGGYNIGPLLDERDAELARLRAELDAIHGHDPEVVGKSWEEAVIGRLRREVVVKDAALRYVLRFLDEYDVNRDLHPSLRARVEVALGGEG